MMRESLLFSFKSKQLPNRQFGIDRDETIIPAHLLELATTTC
jgi:hypothetical protein